MGVTRSCSRGTPRDEAESNQGAVTAENGCACPKMWEITSGLHRATIHSFIRCGTDIPTPRPWTPGLGNTSSGLLWQDPAWCGHCWV